MYKIFMLLVAGCWWDALSVEAWQTGIGRHSRAVRSMTLLFSHALMLSFFMKEADISSIFMGACEEFWMPGQGTLKVGVRPVYSFPTNRG
jgi:hypothetical protein